MSSLLFLLSAYSLLTAAWTMPPYELEDFEFHFESFIQEHNRQYADENEKQIRFQIFKENLEKTNQMNLQSKHTVFGITKFMDLTSEEFVNSYASLRISSNFSLQGCNDISDYQIPDANAPESHDWRQHNAVTRVKNQDTCGGCYAFSSTGNIEGQYAIKHGQLIELSEQQIIDCDSNSNGCNGGYMATAFRSIIQLGGIESETSYPFADVQQSCQFNPSAVAVKLVDCNSYNVVSQEKLKQLLYSVGPISIGVQASSFQNYRSGIITDDFCNVGPVNHAVLLVGYGTENGQPYWIVKNSWKETFGENGYFRMVRGEGAASCGMMNNRLMASAVIQ